MGFDTNEDLDAHVAGFRLRTPLLFSRERVSQQKVVCQPSGMPTDCGAVSGSKNLPHWKLSSATPNSYGIDTTSVANE